MTKMQKERRRAVQWKAEDVEWPQLLRGERKTPVHQMITVLTTAIVRIVERMLSL